MAVDSLRALATAERTTLFTAVLAALQVRDTRCCQQGAVGINIFLALAGALYRLLWQRSPGHRQAAVPAPHLCCSPARANII